MSKLFRCNGTFSYNRVIILFVPHTCMDFSMVISHTAIQSFRVK